MSKNKSCKANFICLEIHFILCISCHFKSELHSNVWALKHTKDGIPSGCVTTKGEDVGVVSSDHGESIRLSGKLCSPLNGSVEHHGFCQSQFSNAVMVAMINSTS